jgi:hypothetical protein
MESKASIPPPRIRFKKLCNSYILRILKFKENHVVTNLILAVVELLGRDINGLVLEAREILELVEP